MRLGIAVARDEGLEIALGDPHRGAEVVRDEVAALDPAAHRAGGDAQALRNLGNREEFDLVVPVSTALAAAASRFRIASTERHHRPTSYPEVERIGFRILPTITATDLCGSNF